MKLDKALNYLRDLHNAGALGDLDREALGVAIAELERPPEAEHTPDQVALMLTEIEESRKAFRKLRTICKTSLRKLRKYQDGDEDGYEYGFVGDVLDDLGHRLEKMEDTIPAEPETAK